MKKIALFIAIAALFSATPAVAEEPFVARVAIAYDIGFLGDSSYNDAVHAAVQIAQKKYKLYEPFVREVPTTGTILDRTTRLRFLAKSGYTLIITVGSGYRDIVRRVSMEYPATQFALINDNSLSQLNISNIYFNESDEAFLAGAVAAASVKVTALKGTKVGIISASDEIAQTFVKGAKFTNSKVAAVAIPFNGDATQLTKDLQSVDVIYSLWDKDSSVLQVAQTLNLKIIARAPDQYFASLKSLPSNVIAVVRKDHIWRIFKDGTSIAETTDTYTIAQGRLNIGNCVAENLGFSGMMDQVRIIKNGAQHVQDYRVANKQFTYRNWSLE